MYVSQGLRALEEAASFGRWWYDPTTHALHLTAQAARQLRLSIPPGDADARLPLPGACAHVVHEDLPQLVHLLDRAAPESTNLPADSDAVLPPQVEVRLLQQAEGLRWLRFTRLPNDPAHPGQHCGIVRDVTLLQHAATRERLSYALTGFLVGSHTLGAAVVHVIQLICRDLGWDWGAYWALEADPATNAQRLVCTYWYPSIDAAVPGKRPPTQIPVLAPGRGIVGSVWRSGEARWVEDIATEPLFVNREAAVATGLVSGYVFPVTWVDDQGRQHRPGVMEFYSSLARQPEAQLPALAGTIGALIAQTAQRLEQQATILQLAQVDGLTGLTNRGHFYHLLGEHCSRAAAAQSVLGLVFIDLDRFKPINDAFGHEAGNVVLRTFAQRLRALAPPGGLVGRLGGDEFAILVPGWQAPQLRTLAQGVLQAASTPFFYEGVELTVSASVGVSTFPEHGHSGPELLRSADAAMYRVKQHGRNDLEISSSALMRAQQAQLAQRLSIETDLHHALEEDALFLAYQPIVDITHGRVVALEALLRWRRADGSVVPPDVFIPIAEQSHLINRIGRWVAARVCRDLAALDNPHFHDLHVHLNMAASEFANSALPAELEAQVDAHGLAPRRLSLELTEGMLMKRPEQVIPVMRALRQRGFAISLDDFGMGHSSLSLLKNLPISSMKIDRSFVRDLSAQGNDRAIVQTILDLGRHLGLDVIAEGVETPAQMDVLRECGCTLVQGYLLSKPMPMEALVQAYPQAQWRDPEAGDARHRKAPATTCEVTPLASVRAMRRRG